MSSLKVGKVGELADGAMKSVSTKQGEFLLARVGNNYYAADNRCPHMKGKLAEGTLEEQWSPARCMARSST